MFAKHCALVAVLLALESSSIVSQNISGRNLDQFSYRDTVTTDENGVKNNIYGPQDWGKMQCPNVDVCLAWPEKYPQSISWEIDSTNHCMWCPATGNSCGAHHESPINLERNLALPNHPNYNMCIDPHLMKYFDSSCSFDELREKNAFIINRYGLKIAQPMQSESSGYKIDCREQPGIGNRYGRIDFPKGYSQWWLLSHIDVKVPSEHTQEGKRYSGELQLHHFYSVTAEEAGINNEIGSVSIFLQVYEDAEDWPELNRVICAWREAEEKTRAECGLPSVATPYPGCMVYTRGHNFANVSTTSTQGVRKLRTTETISTSTSSYKPAVTAADIIFENYIKMAAGNHTDQMKKIKIDAHNYDPMDDFDWDSFIEDQYKEEEVQKTSRRRLMNYEHVPWFNYFPMLKVRTEYFFRYSGTQTIPPCYGKWFTGSDRAQTNHWRVMKDPIKLTQRQIDELHRLIGERIAPKGDLLKSCQPDTAAAKNPNDPGKVSVARPLQSNENAHFAVFCECTNWKSKWVEDNQWCAANKDNLTARLYHNPYNWLQSEF